MIWFTSLSLQSFPLWPLVSRAGPTATAALSACGCGCGVVRGCLEILAAAGEGSIANSRTGRVGVGGLSFVVGVRVALCQPALVGYQVTRVSSRRLVVDMLCCPQSKRATRRA